MFPQNYVGVPLSSFSGAVWSPLVMAVVEAVVAVGVVVVVAAAAADVVAVVVLTVVSWSPVAVVVSVSDPEVDTVGDAPGDHTPEDISRAHGRLPLTPFAMMLSKHSSRFRMAPNM